MNLFRCTLVKWNACFPRDHIQARSYMQLHLFENARDKRTQQMLFKVDAVVFLNLFFDKVVLFDVAGWHSVGCHQCHFLQFLFVRFATALLVV